MVLVSHKVFLCVDSKGRENMDILTYLIRTTLIFAIDVVLMMMFIHAIMSWIAPDNGHKIMIFINNFVDLLTSPVRSILMRFEFARSFPIDLSFTLTWLLLFAVQMALSSV